MYYPEFLTTARNEFTLRDRLLLFLIACSLLGVITGLILLLIPGLQDFGDVLMTVAQTIAEWTGLVLLVLNGTTIKTKYLKFIVACLLLIVMSWLFIVLHLRGGYELLLAGFILLELVYTIRFITRSPTGILDWLKYTWICSWCVTTVFIMFDKMPDIYGIIPAILFWITISMFVLIRGRNVGQVKVIADNDS
jgi:hypothetical protein